MIRSENREKARQCEPLPFLPDATFDASTPGGTAGAPCEPVGSSPTRGAPEGPEAGVKFDGGKLRWRRLFPWRGATEVMKVLEYGAEKYTERDEDGNVTRDGADNWRRVPELQERYGDASLRHAIAEAMGEELDPESELEHLAHAACCILFRLEDLAREREEAAANDIPF